MGHYSESVYDLRRDPNRQLRKKYAFACGAVFGILLEVMLPSLPILNLVIYPALTLLCAQIFADMSEIKRELLGLRLPSAKLKAES